MKKMKHKHREIGVSYVVLAELQLEHRHAPKSKKRERLARRIMRVVRLL